MCSGHTYSSRACALAQPLAMRIGLEACAVRRYGENWLSCWQGAYLMYRPGARSVSFSLRTAMRMCSMSSDLPPPLSHMSEQLHALQHSAYADRAGAQQGQSKALLTVCSAGVVPAQRLQRGFLNVRPQRAVRRLAGILQYPLE